MERLTIDEVIKRCKRKVITLGYAFGRDSRGDTFKCNNDAIVREYWEHKQIAEWLKELKTYKDLEEQGLLLRLPCKVRDTVYWVTKLGVLERYVSSMDLIRTNHIAVKLQPLGLDGELYPFSTIAFSEDFGKTVFLTKEEAEAALAKMKEV